MKLYSLVQFMCNFSCLSSKGGLKGGSSKCEAKPSGKGRATKPVKRKKAAWDYDDTPPKRVRIGTQGGETADSQSLGCRDDEVAMVMPPPKKLYGGSSRSIPGRSDGGVSGIGDAAVDELDEPASSQDSLNSSYDR